MKRVVICNIFVMLGDDMVRYRIEYYGAYYHAIQRGVNKEHIFKDSGDKSYLLKIISDAKDLYDFKLLAYVIMDNHYHFLIQTLNIPISKIMHQINTRYAIYYNKKHERVGHVFENRYKGILVQDESYFITLIKYIHNNPVAAGICNSMEAYKWSSDISYRKNRDTIVEIDEFLNILSTNREKSIEKYVELMEKQETIDQGILMELYENNDIIGTDDFIAKMTFEDEPKLSLDEILQEVCPSTKEFELIKSGSRLRYLTKYKKEYIILSIEEGYKYDEIGKNIGMTSNGVKNHAK